MKPILILFLLTLASCMPSKTECNCTDFKTGKFEFTKEIDGKKITSTFERTDKLQVETFQGKTDSASVRWINNCEFILQKINPKNNAEKKAISMKIVATKEKTYTFEFSFVGDAKKQQGFVTKLD